MAWTQSCHVTKILDISIVRPIVRPIIRSIILLGTLSGAVLAALRYPVLAL